MASGDGKIEKSDANLPNKNGDDDAASNDDAGEAKYFDKLDADAKKRLDFLLNKAEIYSHFISKYEDTKKDEKQSKQRAKRRKVKYAAYDDGEEATKSVYFNESPSFIVNGEMRDYQVDGLNWMVSLYDKGINGILADDMGLGKTIQSVSLLGYLKHHKNIGGPHLVVAPLSTIVNWKKEFERFCPTLKVFILAGAREERQKLLKKKMRDKTWDVCISSFDICRIDQSSFRRIAWRYIVVDEAHRIKNDQAQLSIALRSFTSTNRLLLTGTPLQNDLHELWSLLNFLLPDVFNSAEDFDNWFDPSVCFSNDDMVERLQRILQPFMLRRIKADVEKTLLPKIETKIFVGLSKMQIEWYRKVLLKDVKILRHGHEPVPMRLDNMLMHLRKVANHPYLFDGAEPGPPFTEGEHLVQNSGKMILLDKLLAKLKAQGSRVLIFSQFKTVLTILEDYCAMRKYEYYRLDGDTDHEQRAENMAAFNEGASSTFIFMLTTRAGGLGITLTGADSVIVFDSDWNPQADLQAIDRAHRIGQTKQVRVFRLITENTVDEKIVEVAERKMRLERLVIQQGQIVKTKTLTAEEKKAIVQHGASYVLSATDSNLIDEDIDKILARSAIKTAELKSEYDKMGESALKDIKLDEMADYQQFEGVNFRNLREESNKSLILDSSLRRRAPVKYVTSETRYDKWSKVLSDNFRLYSKPKRMLYLLMQEDNNEITTEEAKELEELEKSGFKKWSKVNFDAYISALCRYGRNDMTNVSKNVNGRTASEVIEYDQVFWRRGPKRLAKFPRLEERIERNESYRMQKLALANNNVENHAPNSLPTTAAVKNDPTPIEIDSSDESNGSVVSLSSWADSTAASNSDGSFETKNDHKPSANASVLNQSAKALQSNSTLPATFKGASVVRTRLLPDWLNGGDATKSFSPNLNGIDQAGSQYTVSKNSSDKFN